MSDFVRMAPGDLMIRPLKSNNGFSLLELIASLALAGILAVALTTIIITAIDGFFLSKDAAEISQKAQLTLARIRIELIDASDISFAGQDKIAFANAYGTYEIERSNSIVTITKTGADPIPAKPLTNGIEPDFYSGNTFFTYQKAGGSPWSTSDGMSELNAIVINLKFGNYNDAFQTSVHPRNNRLRNAPKLVYKAPIENMTVLRDAGSAFQKSDPRPV